MGRVIAADAVQAPIIGNQNQLNDLQRVMQALTFLVPVIITANTVAVTGCFYLMNNNIQLAVPVASPGNAGLVIGAKNEWGTGVQSITTSGGPFQGPGMSSAGKSSFYLANVGDFVQLISDGTYWHIIAGEQETGWIPVSVFGTNWNAGAAVP